MLMCRIFFERFFFDLVLGKLDVGVIDNLGIVFGLDVNILYELLVEKCV